MAARQPEPELKNTPLQSQRTAILVIHGMGEQNPYETLDSFARGLLGFLKETCEREVRLEPREIAHSDWTEVSMRIQVEAGLVDKQRATIDVHEYYWAPCTEDKINLKQTLAWLLRTSLTPLRYLSNNLQEMAGEDRSKTSARLCWLLWREVRRIVFLFLPLAAFVIGLIYWLDHLPAVAEALKPLRVFLEFGPATVFLGYALAAFMALFIVQSLVAWSRRSSFIEKKAQFVWFAGALVMTLVFLGASLWIQRAGSVNMQPVWDNLGQRRFLFAVGVLLAAALLRYFLVKFLGDVAVYVTADAKAKNYAARSAILKGSTEALVRLLAGKHYDNVLLVGHSLGSVIAYDTINEIISAVTAASSPGEAREVSIGAPDLKKLTGLLTFGSPLDKIYYFFRQQVGHDQAIRAQILSMLYSFRKVQSHRNYGEFKFHYALPKLEQLRWLNAWSPLDPVSARLHFYNVDIQEWFWYWVPVLAHLSYWHDPRFYLFFGRHLLFVEKPDVAIAAAPGHQE